MVTGKSATVVSGTFRLIKPLLTLAVTFSGLAGFLMASPFGGVPELVIMILALFLVAGGSAAMNQYQERDYDKQMQRTAGRPIPGGIIKPAVALTISLLFIIVGLVLMLSISPLASLLSLVNALIYNLIYTPLKRRSYLAILPGGVVGALPPLIGYFAAGAVIMNGEIVVLALFMFTWQLPHFWLLMIRYRKEYKEAGFATMSDKLSDGQIRRVAFAWSVVSSMLLLLFAIQSELSGVITIIALLALNITFIVVFYLTLFGSGEKRSLRRAFILLNIFSLLALIVMIVLSIMR